MNDSEREGRLLRPDDDRAELPSAGGDVADVGAVGFRVDEHVVCTIVLPRESLPFLRLAFATYE